ncbi:MAG: hypothetical protein WC878_07180 [Candidatus Paceibacterota bacterium]
MNGTLRYYAYYIPEDGESVIIMVPGKGFPSGVWKGVLTAVAHNPPEEYRVKEYLEPHDEMRLYDIRCIAEITDDRAPAEYRNKKPIGNYDVYPDYPGMGEMLNKLHAQKAEVKALKKENEITKETVRAIFQGMARFDFEKSLRQVGNFLKK